MNRSNLLVAALLLAAVALTIASPSARADQARREALALKVVAMTGAADVGGQFAAGLLSQLKPMFPTVPNELWAEITGSFSSEEIIGLSVPVYVKHFSEDELAALAEFYESPLGQKLLEKMPLVMQESYVVGNEYTQRKANEVIERLKAAGHEPQSPQ